MKWWKTRWLGDPHLRLCTSGDRGNLADLSCIADDSDDPGYVRNGSKYLTDEDIREFCGLRKKQWKDSSRRLIEKGRLGWDKKKKAYFVPSLVRDAESRNVLSKAGKKGQRVKKKKSRYERFMNYADAIWWRIKAKAPVKELDRLYGDAAKDLGKKAEKELRELMDDWKKNGKPEKNGGGQKEKKAKS